MSGMATQVTAATAVGSSLGAATVGGLPFCKAAATNDPAAGTRRCFKPEDLSIAGASQCRICGGQVHCRAL